MTLILVISSHKGIALEDFKIVVWTNFMLVFFIYLFFFTFVYYKLT